MFSMTEGFVEVRGSTDVLLAELSTLVYSLVVDAHISSGLISDAVKNGLDLAEKNLTKEDGNKILEKYLAELSSRVLGEGS